MLAHCFLNDCFKMTKNTTFYILIIISLVVFSCDERDRNNIFDPNNKNKHIEIGFRLSSEDSTITLFWNPPGNIEYNSINIFRKVQSESETVLYAIVEKGITHFIDTDIIYDREYSYFITISGKTEESYPTKTLSTIPGPGSIWIIDSYLWEIKKLNYDLSSVSLRKATFLQPENLAFSTENDLALVTYPRFRNMELFDVRTGEFKAENTNLGHPFDAVYDSNNNNFWLVDSSGSLYSIDTVDANAQLITQELSNPVQIDIFAQNLYILDQGKNKIFIYDTSPQLIDSIFQKADHSPFIQLKKFRIDKVNSKIYFIDGQNGNTTLYSYNLLDKQLTSLYQDSIISSFDINQTDETIWIIIAKRLNSNLVQLFGNEIRHFNVSELEQPIEIKVNSINGNIVITDFKVSADLEVPNVFHYRSDLSPIGTYSTYGIPSKVYIE